jgi:hypothetical protein
MREGEEKETQTSVHTGLCLHTSMGGGRGAGHGCLCTQDCVCIHPGEGERERSWRGEELRRSREGIHHVTYS